MGIDGLAPLDSNGTSGVLVDVSITKPANGASIEMDISLKTAVPINIGVGTLTFTELDFGYHNKLWSVDGKAILNNFKDFAKQGFDLLDMQSNFDLDIAYKAETKTFLLTTIIDPAKKTTIIPDLCTIDLNSIQLASGPKGVDFSILSKLTANNIVFPGSIGFNPSLGEVKFRPDASVSVGFSLVFDKLGTLKVDGMTFTLGEEISVETDSVKLIAANDQDMLWRALNTSELNGSFKVSDKDGFEVSMQIPGGKLGGEFDMDAVGTAKFNVSEITVSTKGELVGTGTADIGDFGANITLGTTINGPIIDFKPRGTAPLQAIVTDEHKKLEAIFKSGKSFRLATNVLGIPTLTFESVEFRIEDPKNIKKPFFDLATDNLVFYLPGAAGTGMLFFDKFEGIIKIAGLDCHVELSFPDPLSTKNTDEAITDIKNLLIGKINFVEALSTIKAPSFSIKKSYAKLPPKLFGNGAILKIPDKIYNLDILRPLVTSADNLTEITTRFLESSLKEAQGTTNISILGVTANSKLNFDGKQFKSEVDFNAPIGSHTQLDATLIGNFSNTSYKLEANGTVKVKGGSKWKTMSGAQITFTQDGLSFGAKLFNAKGTGSITKEGFSFHGKINTSVFKGTIDATPKSFHIIADAYADGHKIIHVDTGFTDVYIKLHVNGHPKGDNYNFKYDGHLYLGITDPSLTCSVDVDGTIGISKIKINSKLKVRHNYISGWLKAGLDCYYFRVYLKSSQGKTQFHKSKCK